MEQYKILSVRDEDIPACAETIRRAFSVSAKRFGFTKENYPSSGAFITEEMIREKKQKGVHMYAAWIDGRIAGYVQLEKLAAGIYSFQKFSVLPEYQQSGIGSALIAFCKNKATIYGGKEIHLIMVYENKKLLSLYESYGFVLTETKSDDAHPFLQGIMVMKL